ncbi:MAG TPA: nucleotidyltransferase family protein [Polyangia bacterium]|nr:nucleotidyltransferase family protein [Polyangia bacterium]
MERHLPQGRLMPLTRAERMQLSTVRAGATLRDAMLALESGGTEVTLVVGGDRQLVGIVTDGDLRRALLRGATLDTSIDGFVNARFVSVGPAAARTEVLDQMQARRIGQIPIVDDDGTLVGLHLMHDVLGTPERANWAVIMAGGRGTRLAPLTENVPKPMLRVAGRPILERLVLHAVGFGIRRLFLAINYLGSVVEEHFGDGARFGCRIEYLREPRALGTGGALSLLPEPAREPLLVMNGDLVTQANLGAMLDAHAHGGHAATLGVRRYFHTVPFGCVEIESGRVRAMEEKPTLTRLVNAGIYVLGPQVVGRVVRDTELALPSLLDDCLQRGESVSAFEIEDDWIDVGQREQLAQARGRSA